MTVPTTWILTDGAAGNEKQALALAAALRREAMTLHVAPRAPWRWFAPRWVPADGGALGLQVAPPWPQLAIGCGRQGALALRWLKRASAGETKTVQILDPRIDPLEFDLVLAPGHDDLHGANVIATHGALHAIDSSWLARAKLEWAKLGTLPGPRTVVLLGGSLLLTTSRRSPDWLREAARNEFSAVPGLQWHDPDDGPNPYAGMLSWADRIVVTPDSVNLLSEACATAAPVLCHFERPLRGKLAHFYRELLEAGRVRPMKLDYTAWPVEPLRETDAVAAQVRERLAL
jgi:mitochondrial fission protein ELM1